MNVMRSGNESNGHHKNRKYEITNETKVVYGRTLYRIRAIQDFDDVKAGDLGGFIEKEINLSHEGKAWISDNACVYDTARVCDDARVYGSARICDNAKICDNACIFDNVWISDNARVSDDARVYGNMYISGSTTVSGSGAMYTF